MAFSKLFKPFFLQNSSEPQLNLEDLYSCLTNNKSSINNVDKNIRRTLERYGESIKHINGKDVVTVRAVIRYCFNNSDKIKGCQDISTSVITELCDKLKPHSISTSLELYKHLASLTLSKCLALFDTIDINESKIVTLIHEHKDLFDSSEWKKICWFESHFSKEYEDVVFKKDYDDLLNLKIKKFLSLSTFHKCSQKLHTISKENIQEKQRRMKTFSQHQLLQVHAKKFHVPYIIENDLQSLLDDLYGDWKVRAACFDVSQSVQYNCIEVALLSVNKEIPQNMDDVSQQMFYKIKRKHHINLHSVYVMYEDEVKDYLSGELDDIHRFSLRDAIECGEITDFVYHWTAGCLSDTDSFSGSDNDDDDDVMCEACSDHVTKPLDLEKFHLLNEWYLETPIEIQIIFEGFINRSSVRKTICSKQFYEEKLKRLYVMYDTFLNLMNKNYFGIFQTKSSNELLIDYKSVSAVFNITSGFGSTAALSTAEKKLKKSTDSDICYYNTFLKHHKMPYLTVQGEIQNTVNLRNCHLILMLDNLVRLRHTTDPSPGENRSKQMCTLPITLQGLPIDCHITKKWHTADCDGSNYCTCKQRDLLTKQDVDWCLFEKTDEEDQVSSQFSELMTWGHTALWRHLPDEVLAFIELDSSTSLINTEDVIPTSEQVFEEKESEEDDGLSDILHETEDADLTKHSDDDSFSDDDLMSVLETSFDQMCILESDYEIQSSQNAQQILSSFGFTKHIVPELLCRHPPPAIGRDDDMSKIAEILDDILRKMGYFADQEKMVNRILCGPDQKIGVNLLRLIESDSKFESFLPEFPLLHLRKSKITILFSAYRDAGLVQLLKFMKDDDQEEWSKLISIQHIDCATRYIRRLAISFHLAFLIAFSRTLASDDLHSFIHDMENKDGITVSNSWSGRLEGFMNYWSKHNATFALHRDMMNHCDHVIAIALSERLGGPKGYALLLASVKSSLLFSYLNNASSYAPYCTKMLYHHYSAGHFHRCLKETLYSTPFRNSNRNFSSDTKREMDHLEALKGFRAGSNTQSITCRMSLIDYIGGSSQTEKTQIEDSLGWELTEVDKKHILPTVSVILERKGLQLVENLVPYNVYTQTPIILSPDILDDLSYDAGKFLVYRYCAEAKLFQMSTSTLPNIEEFSGSKALIQKIKRSRGVTIKRMIKNKAKTMTTDREKREEERLKIVAKETKIIECFSSENNACQALVHPDSSKPKVMKSLGIQRALQELLRLPSSSLNSTENSKTCVDQYMSIGLACIPLTIMTSMKVCLFEFSGVKFKIGNIKSGKEYLQYIECFLNNFFRNSNCVAKLVICEEKYTFTPDDFKAGTRQQRKAGIGSDITHLKSGENVLSLNSFDKDVLNKSQHGKKKISTFLGENIEGINLDKDMDVIVDSDFSLHFDKNTKEAFATPVTWNKSQSKSRKKGFLHHVNQRKGEAEMAIVDWLIHYKNLLKEGESVVSVISSGDIDAVYIHMYSVAKLWPRKSDNTFFTPVYVVLQKPYKKYDIYNITLIVEKLELEYCDQTIGMKIGLVLSMGGNDFIPKIYQVSHKCLLKAFIDSHVFKDTLFNEINGKLTLNSKVYVDLIQYIYCPKKYRHLNLSFDKVRALSIGKKNNLTKNTGWKTKDPRMWLPPRSCLERLANLINMQIQYLNTAGKHDASLPDFSDCTCLKKNRSGEVEYDFGPGSHFHSIDDLPVLESLAGSHKRKLNYTPQSGARRKRPLTSTPKSSRKEAS